MSSLILKRWSLLSQNSTLKPHIVTRLLSSLIEPQYHHAPSSNSKRFTVPGSGLGFWGKNVAGSSPVFWGGTLKFPRVYLPNSICSRLFGSQAAPAEPSTSDGLTVEGIIANQWPILDESESDWKSHASAIALSIHLIKKRLQWKKLIVRLELLSSQLDKPDLWEDPVRAGKISREHGSIMSKMKEMKAFEQQLLEHIDMIKLAREENDADLESVGPQFF